MSCHPRDAAFPLLTTLRQTRRPLLLLRTARMGLPDYQRERDLKRILRLPAPPAATAATLATLLDLEAEHERLRTLPMTETGAPWRAASHVEVLIALLAEARLVLDWVPAGPGELIPFAPQGEPVAAPWRLPAL